MCSAYPQLHNFSQATPSFILYTFQDLVLQLYVPGEKLLFFSQPYLTHWNTNLIRKKLFQGRFITYNSIQTMYDIPFDRSFLQLSNGIRHVVPSTDKARMNSIGLDGSASHRRQSVPMGSVLLLSLSVARSMFSQSDNSASEK